MTRVGDLQTGNWTRQGVSFLLLLLIVSWGGGCNRSASSQSDVVRIGYQKTGTLNVLRLRGALEPDMERLGLRVRWIGFPSGPQLLEALNARAIDFGHTGDAPPILAQAAGVSFVYAACAPPRPHEEAIVVPTNSALRSIEDLEGKRVALNKGSNVHWLLVQVLKSAHVPYESVHKLYLAPSDARAAFEGGSVDAWAVWDPYLAEAELNAGARLLADGEGLVTNREMHLASRRLVEQRPDAIRAIVAALNRVDDWAKEHSDEVATLMATELGLDFEVMRRIVGRKAYGVALIGDEVLSEQQQIADSFLQLGLIPSPIDVREAALPDSFTNDAGHRVRSTGSRSDDQR